MTELEKKIKSNREKFDGFEPSGDHMEKFRAKLFSSPRRHSFFARIPYAVKVAAVLVLVAISSIMIYEQAQQYYTAKQKPLEKILPGDYNEAQVYYTSLIREKSSEIQRLNSGDPERSEILYLELREMDRMFNSLLKDLQANPRDERVLSAMITHYQLKLEVMGEIIKQLEKANQINSTYKNHENTDV